MNRIENEQNNEGEIRSNKWNEKLIIRKINKNKNNMQNKFNENKNNANSSDTVLTQCVTYNNTIAFSKVRNYGNAFKVKEENQPASVESSAAMDTLLI